MGSRGGPPGGTGATRRHLDGTAGRSQVGRSLAHARPTQAVCGWPGTRRQMEPAAGTRLLPGDLTSARAVGRHGNTTKGRLDRLDALLRLYEPELFDVPGAGSSGHGADEVPCEVCVDVGFGDTVDTFIDFARSLRARRAAGTLRIIGTESDPSRLAAAQASLGASLEDSSLALRQAESDGWFVLPLLEGEPAPVFIRALNVLRDYHPADARRGLLTLGAQLAHGGLLMEGSASTPGHTAVVVLARRKAPPAMCTIDGTSAAAGRDQLLPALTLEALCFSVDFDRRDAPKLKGPPNRWFTRQIPQLWQHQHTKAGESGSGADGPPASNKRKRGGERKWLGGGGAVSDFLAVWSTVCDEQNDALKAMTQRERSQIDGSPRARWEQSVRTLARRVDGVDTSQATLSAGFLIWRPQHEELRPAEGGREAARERTREGGLRETDR